MLCPGTATHRQCSSDARRQEADSNHEPGSRDSVFTCSGAPNLPYSCLRFTVKQKVFALAEVPKTGVSLLLLPCPSVTYPDIVSRGCRFPYSFPNVYLVRSSFSPSLPRVSSGQPGGTPPKPCDVHPAATAMPLRYLHYAFSISFVLSSHRPHKSKYHVPSLFFIPHTYIPPPFHFVVDIMEEDKHSEALTATSNPPSPSASTATAVDTPASVPAPEGSSTGTPADVAMYNYEQVMSFDNQSGSSSGRHAGMAGLSQKKSIKSDSSIELEGPMEVDGSVKSMGGITFTGDFAIRDRIEAYQDIDLNGNLTCKYVVG